MRKAWLLCCAIGVAPTAYADPLRFSDAVTRAAADGPTIAEQSAAVSAAQSSIRPAGQLPDPQLVLGAQNVPVEGVDRYRFDRDPMTMGSVGVMQEMSNGAKLGARKGVALAQMERAQASLEIAKLQARLGAAQAWIRLYYAQQRQDAVGRLAQNARSLADTTRASLAAGGATVDDTLAAEIDAARIEDRKADLIAAVSAARADLRRWLGNAADEPLAADAPVFVIVPDQLRVHLDHHPELEAFDSAADEATANLRLARAAAYPDWSWQVSYGRRDQAFGDMASVEVRIGLPLFQGARQRPLINARQADVTRVGAERETMVREHTATLDARLAEHEALIANLKRAMDIRLPLARQRSDAAIAGHENGSVTMAQLIAIRKDVLETELDVTALQEREAEVGAYLTLEYGELAP